MAEIWDLLLQRKEKTDHETAGCLYRFHPTCPWASSFTFLSLHFLICETLTDKDIFFWLIFHLLGLSFAVPPLGSPPSYPLVWIRHLLLFPMALIPRPVPFLFNELINLVASGLSCSTQASLVVAHGFSGPKHMGS